MSRAGTAGGTVADLNDTNRDSESGGGGHQPIVLPPPEDGQTSWVRGLPLWLVLSAVLLSAYGVYEAGDRGWFDLDGSDPNGRAEAAVVRPDTARASGAARRFHVHSDSLERAAEGYRDRRSDYEQNRIGCPTLSAGYRTVDRHFVLLSVLMREEGDQLDAAARRRYEELTKRVNEVNRHFDGTGCRPAG